MRKSALPSRHCFVPDPFRPRECAICGRRENAHPEARDLARLLVLSGAIKGRPTK